MEYLNKHFVMNFFFSGDLLYVDIVNGIIEFQELSELALFYMEKLKIIS